jgi:N-methylhydantoinase B
LTKAQKGKRALTKTERKGKGRKDLRKIDPVTLEVARARLEAIVEEMGGTLLRTAHSSIFVECKDYSVALLRQNGDLLAMGQFIPHHQGGMQAALKSVIAQKGLNSIQPGDVYLTNDPYLGGTHTPDMNMFMPVFYGKELVLWCGSCAHQIDLGGGAPGAYVVGATEVYQEGICFPPIQVGKNGELFDDFIRTYQRNVRLPEQQKGDILAMHGAVRVGLKSVSVVVDEHRIALFRDIVEEILDSAERQVRQEIKGIPDGVYKHTDYLDHDGVDNKIYKLKLTMTIKGSNVTVDFAGTDPQAKGFINASYWNTVASSYCAFFLFLDPTIPRNGGFFRPITVKAPKGSVLNPHFPAPIGGSTTEGGGRVYDMVLAALSKACPERALGTWSMMWTGLVISGQNQETGGPFIHWVLDGLATGGGARTNYDGLNATHITASNMLIPNVEAEEGEYPVMFIRRELSTDSGGPGTKRGGLSMETELEVLCDCEFTAFTSRFRGNDADPPGVYGGMSGTPSDFYKISPNGEITNYPAKVGRVQVKAGDRLVLRPTGGGGYGDPRMRSRNEVEEDLRLGFISPEAAERDYGYVTKVAAE